MRAIKSSGKHKIKGKAEADETVVGGQEEGTKGRKNNKNKLVVFAIERKGKGISRMYGKVIKQSNSKELGGIPGIGTGKGCQYKNRQMVRISAFTKGIL